MSPIEILGALALIQLMISAGIVVMLMTAPWQTEENARGRALLLLNAITRVESNLSEQIDEWEAADSYLDELDEDDEYTMQNMIAESLAYEGRIGEEVV